MMNLVIFGAQGIALGAYRFVCKLFPWRNILCFLVSKAEENPLFLDGVPVYELETFSRKLTKEEKEELEVLIAVPENIMSEIEVLLDKKGFPCHVRLDSRRWAEMAERFYLMEGSFLPLSALPAGFHLCQLQAFMARFYKDKPLKQKYEFPDWIREIQVGSALCKERIAELCDNKGEHISEKNGNYSELTALYWIWKNRLEIEEESENTYFGLAHYRRILQFREDDLLRLEDNGVDVVLPYPMPYEPDIEKHHKRYLSDEDWQALLQALEELEPKYANEFPNILKQQYLYNYNIIVARKSVLKAYCSWLFPILERVEQLSVPRGWERRDRYIGYMGETLETLYFMYHKSRLNIVHSGCIFLV